MYISEITVTFNMIQHLHTKLKLFSLNQNKMENKSSFQYKNNRATLTCVMLLHY